MHRWRLFIVLAVAAAVSLAFLWLTEVPLGIPGEWTWQRITYPAGRVSEWLLGWGVAVLAGAGYLAAVLLGASRIGRCSRGEAAAWLVGLVVAGFGWLSIVQGASPPGVRDAKPLWVLYDPGSSGYFFEAHYKFDDVRAFLAGYEERMAEGDVLHVGTHPPGLFLLHRGLLRVCRDSPALRRLAASTIPHSVNEAFSELQRHVVARPLDPAGRAALWLAVLLTRLAAAATVVPLYALLRRSHAPRTCWLVAALWPLVPALAVFLPKSDALLPCLGCLFLATWLTGRDRSSVVLCCLAGLVLWTGLFLSLALLPVVLLAGLLTLWELRSEDTGTDRRRGLRRLSLHTAGAAAGFLIPVAVLWSAYGLNLFAVWSWNYANHAAFYEQFSRTYWKWLLVNPVELAFAVGLPVLIAAGVSCGRVWRSVRSAMPHRSGPWLACPLVLALLWISGKNMGEAARLWLVVMPWLVWLAVDIFDSPLDQSINRTTVGSPQMTAWLFVAGVQLAVCVATVSRVGGFHFADPGNAGL